MWTVVPLLRLVCTKNKYNSKELWKLANTKIWRQKDHRMTEWIGLEGTYNNCLILPSTQSRISYSRLPWTMSSWVLRISTDEASTTSLGNLLHCWTTISVKYLFLMFKWIILYFNVCPLSLVLSLVTTEKSLALSSFLHPSVVYIHW